MLLLVVSVGQTAACFQMHCLASLMTHIQGSVVDQLSCPLLVPCHACSLLPHNGLNPEKGWLG